MVREEMWVLTNRVWKGEGWPEDWRTGIIVPLVKKGEGKMVDVYRGIILMPVGYRVYAEILRGVLEKYEEEIGGIVHNQTGFRKRMETMDQIYTLNYLVGRNLANKGLASVNRRVLWRTLRVQGVEDGLIERLKEIYTDVRARVRVSKKVGKFFWIGRRLMQGCPLSPLLFNLLMADLKEKL